MVAKLLGAEFAMHIVPSQLVSEVTTEDSCCNKPSLIVALATTARTDDSSDTSSDDGLDPDSNLSDKLLLDKYAKKTRKHYQSTKRKRSRFHCLICKKQTFERKFSMLQHIHFHLGIKRFECKFCKAKFVQKCNLKDHLKRKICYK